MNAAPRQPQAAWIGTLKEWSPIAATALALVYFGEQCISSITGGFRPQTQIAADSLSAKVDNLQGDVTQIKKTLQEQPSAYEVGDQRSHLSRLDDRITRVEVEAGRLEGRVNAIEHPVPARSPN